MTFKHPSKRFMVIVAVSIGFVAVAGLYTWQSIGAWKSYESRLMAEEADYTTLKNTALSADTSKERLAAIRKLDDKLDARDTLCAMNGLYAWQAVVIPPLREGVKRCEAKVKQLGLVAVPLKALREYLEAGEKIQAIVKNLKPGAALTESNWTVNGLERAKKAAAELKALRLSGDAATLKSQAGKLCDSLIVAWQNLIKANDAKDKTAFLSASVAVAKAHADFMGLADTADAELQQKVEAVMKEADKL